MGDVTEREKKSLLEMKFMGQPIRESVKSIKGSRE